MPYFVEYTDTFGGEANYDWVRRAIVQDDDMTGLDYKSPAYKARLMRLAKASVGLTGARGRYTADYGDGFSWVPYGCCTVLMVNYCDREEALRHA